MLLFLFLPLASGVAFFTSGAVLAKAFAGLATGLAGGLTEVGLAAGAVTVFVFGRALFVAAFAGGAGRAGFFGKLFTGFAAAFLTGAGACLALAGIFFGAAFFATTFA